MAAETPHLNPADLYDKRRSKDSARLRTYNKILEQIYHRIRTMSKLPQTPAYLLYQVPPFIFGLPKIDMEDCIVYLLHQLRHATYDVRYTPPNMLYISWQHHEKSYLVEQSPIMLSMLDSYERTQAELERKEKEASRLLGPKKSVRKTPMQAPGAFQRGRHPALSLMAQQQPPQQHALSAGPPPPSAGEYVPPSAFLQSVSQPPSTIEKPKSVPDYFRR